METGELNAILEEEDEIDLRELFFVLRKHIVAIILACVVGASAALAFTVFLMQPVYKSSSMIYIFSKTTTVTSAIDLQLGSQLTVDFEILGTSRPVLERVIEELALDTDYETLLSAVEVTNPKDSRIIKITVTNTDPQLACDIANSLANNLAARVAEVIDTTKPSSVEDAVPALKPFSPSKSKNTMMGGILGAMAAMAIILISYFSDMSIRNEDDVRKYLGLSTLASIPYEKSVEEKYDTVKVRKSRAKRNASA
ncbi:YveK family protein [Butyrivibrio sp. MC2013]|uniref:YveK family protein n=1 Tax=Butyrivibrio sp. MC2013 TaxID=1280686 RepID=UPI00040C6183|nr:Wzz/FepE/Etk N-terminal domain-containing protein [Butyrivibrio sp. MC2013]